MPLTPHIEKHFKASEAVRDIVIGMSDGLTVPFALAAGVTGVIGATAGLVVTAGLAEIAAGSIAMGLGGFLAARTDLQHYESEQRREYREVERVPDLEAEEIAEIFREYGLDDAAIKPVIDKLRQDPDRWVDFMMKFELHLEKPDPHRAFTSAGTIAASYLVGGLIPLLPYMLVGDMKRALWISVAVTLVALFVFGYVKARFTALSPWKGAVQTMLIGGIAAAAAFGIARLVGAA